MSLRQLLFPDESRHFWGKRWLNVIFRSVHLCGMGVYTGGVFFNVAPSATVPAYLATTLSGLAIMGMDLFGSFKFIFQNRGFFILLKLALLGALPHIPEYQKWGLLGVIVLSSVLSHATANFRYYSLFHRKQI